MNPCGSHGTCVDQVDSYDCDCDPGYTGSTCESEIDECASLPCVHGTCVDEIDSFSCNCTSTPGYHGTLCELTADDDYCFHHPSVCFPFGVCVSMGSGLYRCDCFEPGFVGMVNCTGCATGTYADGVNQTTCIECPSGRYQPEINSTSCLNCTVDFYQPLPAQTACIPCPSGTRGFLCMDNSTESSTGMGSTAGDDSVLDACASNPCQNGGTCVEKTLIGEFNETSIEEFICLCPVPWIAPLCATTSLEEPLAYTTSATEGSGQFLMVMSALSFIALGITTISTLTAAPSVLSTAAVTAGLSAL